MPKYVDFELIEKKPKTNVYAVESKSDGSFLGEIYWYFPWRQYVFEPTFETLWSRGCLQEIQDFIEKLMKEKKKT